MRVLILTQYFPPEMGAPQARLSELGERLIDRGFEVEALTALPSYPGAKVFDGYDPLKPVVETIGRIRTVRVPLVPSNSGFAKRLGSYFSFVGSAMFYGPKLCTRPDLIFVESPPLFIAYAAWYLAARWRCPYVFNVSDLWPDGAIRMGVVKKGALPTRLAERLEESAYRRAAGVTGQTNEIIEGVLAKAPGKPTCVVTNGVDPLRFGKSRGDAEARALLGPEPGPIFIFAGLFGLAQGLDQILDAAKRLPADVPGRFVLVGEGPMREKLVERIEKEKITRVKILPQQPRNRIPALLAESDVALVTLGLHLPGAVPSKIYEAMASSLPIILVAVGEAASRVEKASSGITVKPGDLDGLTAAIEKLARDASLRAQYGAGGRAAAETTYHRDRIADVLAAFLKARIEERPQASFLGTWVARA